MNNQRQLLLGIFFIVALSILAFYTLFLTDIHLFSQPTLETVYFPDAYGLRKGDQVRAAGVRIGRVSSLNFDGNAPPERQIRAVLSLDEDVELLVGARITIKESTLLGGRHVDIYPGEFGGPPLERDPQGALYGTVERNPIQALAELGKLFTDNRENVKNSLTNLEEVIADVRAGRGTIGRLLGDDQMAQDLADGIASLRASAAEIRAGEGTLGALIYDAELADSVRNMVDNLEAMVADIRAGQGLAGRLIYDDKLGDDVQRGVDAAANVAERIDRGEGVIGRLVADEELGLKFADIIGNVDEASGDLQAITAQLRSGDGTLGKLVMDEELYDKALTSVQLLNRSLEDYREAAPVTAFTVVLFAAF